MRTARLLILSAGLNTVLALAAAHLLRAPARVTLHADEQRQTEHVRVVTNLPSPIAFVTNAFHWRQLESTNYDTFVANLRAVGCPERTIRDIVEADVWARWEFAQGGADDAIPFWSNGPRRVAAERAHEASLIQLKNDLAATLQRLFGIAWSPELKRDAFGEGQLLCRILLGDVTEEQFGRAAGLLGRVGEIKEEMISHTHGILLNEDYAELAQRRDALEQKLQAILSPAQFDEFRARAGAAEQLIGHLFSSGDGLEDLKPSPEEWRRIALARAEVWPLGWEILDLGENETTEQKEARERLMDEQLRKILGADRFAEALLLRDGSYRDIHRFSQANQVSSDAAHKLYDIQKLAREEVQRLREDKSLAADARSMRIEAVTAAVAPQVDELLGPKLFGEYLRQSGQWVTNANRL